MSIAETKKRLNISIIIKFVIIVLPVMWGFYIVTKYGVNIFYGDEWTYVDHKDSFLTLDYLWEQHNEHRMFFPKIVAYIVGQLFSWNSKMFMYTSQLFLLFLYVIVIFILLGEDKVLTWVKTLEIFLLGMCIYNTCQYENFLWGFQTAWFMIVALGTASFYFYDIHLKTDKLKYLILSLAFAVIVSYSSLHGQTIWGGYAVLFITMLIGKEKISKTSLISTIIIASCSILIYFKGYRSVSHHEQYLGKNPDQILSYFVAQIGATMLSYKVIYCYLLGFIAFFIAMLTGVYFLAKKEIKCHIKNLGPMIMSCGAMFITSIGRSGGGTGTFIASRYTTNSMLFITFFLLTGFEIINKLLVKTNKKESNTVPYIGCLRNNLTNAFFVLTILFPILILARNFGALSDASDCYISRMHAKLEMANYKTTSLEGLQTFAPVNADSMSAYLENINYLKDNNLNSFSDDISELVYKEVDFPKVESIEYLTDSIFTSNNITVTDSKIMVSISELGEIAKKNLNDCQFILNIKDKSYHMPLDSDCVRFEKALPDLEDGFNELQFVVIKGKIAYYSKSIFLFKNSENIQVGNGIQKDSSVLYGYTEISDTRTYAIDALNGMALSDENILYNNEVSSISGWVRVSDTNKKTCYLRIGDAYFELNWCDRQDVIDAFGDEGYSGFWASFLPVTVSSGPQDVAIVIVDSEDKTYVETSVDVVISFP